jgi:hypothetical protein
MFHQRDVHIFGVLGVIDFVPHQWGFTSQLLPLIFQTHILHLVSRPIIIPKVSDTLAQSFTCNFQGAFF